jgi:NAD+ synthase (glutamine-hydrolysing)
MRFLRFKQTDTMTLHVRVAQLNLTVGDLVSNTDKIVEAASQAHLEGAQLVLTPELSLCGYPAEDLLLRPAFVAACDDALNRLMSLTTDFKGLFLVVGHPVRVSGAVPQRERAVSVPGLLNMVSVISEGRCVARYAKRCLPNYQVFDERRYFVPGDEAQCFDVPDGQGHTVRVGLLICEDAWFEAPAADCVRLGAELLVVVNASPFHAGKGYEREKTMRDRAVQTGLPLIYAHGVGGQDELVFEGRSFVVAADGEVCGRAVSFVPDLFAISVQRTEQGLSLSAAVDRAHSEDADLWHALVLGVRDYINKNRFPGVLLGLSGGIDSALVLAVAVDALGRDRVRAVMMPSPYTADISWIDARDMAARLGVQYDEIAIAPQFDAFNASLAPVFQGLAEDTTEENLQARIRGTLLMAMSNKLGSLVLTTGNKSEMATGYCTLYGDMAGGFAVIKDVLKTKVFALARWRNAHDPFGTGSNPIPERIITRPPSAELRPDQTDQDSLPAYEVLDAIIERYMENDESPEQIKQAGFDGAAVDKVVRLIRINEYKRRQSPVGIRVSHRSFGKDWRYPITNGYRG